jgi:DegV family protein with EDD domain
MVTIVGDTTSGVPQEVVDRYNMSIIPQVIIFGTESYLEGLEINQATFMEKLKLADELPKTAAPPPDLFVTEFARLRAQGEEILCILPSSVVSGTVRSATVAAREFPDADIRIIDTGYIASPLVALLRLAGKWAADGESIDEIESRIYEMLPRCRVYFLVDTLKYMAKGGRIGGAAALLGGVLQVKPVLTLEKGRVEMFEKVRTKKRAVCRLKDLVLEQYPKEAPGYLAVMHAGVPQEAQAFADDLVQALEIEEEPFILDVPPAIVVHAGPGVLGVSFYVDAEET